MCPQRADEGAHVSSRLRALTGSSVVADRACGAPSRLGLVGATRDGAGTGAAASGWYSLRVTGPHGGRRLPPRNVDALVEEPPLSGLLTLQRSHLRATAGAASWSCVQPLNVFGLARRWVGTLK